MNAGRFKRTKWKEGMVFAVPLESGSFGLAQAVSDSIPNVIYVTLFSDIFSEVPTDIPELEKNNVISLAATWKQDLNNGSWAKIGISPILIPKENFPNESFSKNGYVGAKNHDVGLLEDFLSAFHGLIPWNVMYDEKYWESLLAPGVKVPNTANILSSKEREQFRNNEQNA